MCIEGLCPCDSLEDYFKEILLKRGRNGFIRKCRIFTSAKDKNFHAEDHVSSIHTTTGSEVCYVLDLEIGEDRWYLLSFYVFRCVGVRTFSEPIRAITSISRSICLRDWWTILYCQEVWRGYGVRSVMTISVRGTLRLINRSLRKYRRRLWNMWGYCEVIC